MFHVSSLIEGGCLFTLPSFSSETQPSGTDAVGDPIKKCSGVRQAKSSVVSPTGQRGREFKIPSTFTQTVLNSS